MTDAAPRGGRTLRVRAGSAGVGLPLERVRGVRPLPPLTRAPGAGAAVLGVASLGGLALPVLSLARLLGQAEAPADRSGRVVVVERRGWIGLAVEAVEGFAPDDAHGLDLERLLDGAAVAAVDGGGAAASPLDRRSGDPDGQAQAASLASFRLAGQVFAVALARVERVVDLAGEGAGRSPFASLVRLGMGDPVRARHGLVLSGPLGACVLAVDAIGPVLRPVRSEMDPATAALRRRGITAVVRREAGALVAVLDVDVLAQDAGAKAAERSLAMPVGTAQDVSRVLVLEGRGVRRVVEVDAVAGVARARRLLRAPGAPEAISGAMAWGGGVAPVVALEPGLTDGWVAMLRLGGALVGVLTRAAPRMASRDEAHADALIELSTGVVALERLAALVRGEGARAA